MKTIEFPVSIYGAREQVNDVLTKARCRIFYKGGNRNGTYITDAFAEELISSLHYVPVKGIYGDDDFTDHGIVRSEGRIYGIVPETNNFAWEDHEDEDGVMRTYACSDVYLFTALYPEADTIVGKGQSMELYSPTLTYHLETIEDKQWIVFEHGSFLGLQVLGDTTEPCFEGASFFSLQETIEHAIEKIKMYTLGGKDTMPNLNFAISDREKFDKIWQHINPDYNEEAGWIIRASLCEVYDEYALVYSYDTGKYTRVYYTKENDEVLFGEEIEVYVIDVTDDEYKTVQALRELNGNTYAELNANLTDAAVNAEKVIELNTKIEEMAEAISTLNTEAEEASTAFANLSATCDELKEQNAALQYDNESLSQYKHKIEMDQKNAVIDQYVDYLDAEVIQKYRAAQDEYSMEELDMRLSYELKKAGKVFGKPVEPVTGFVVKGTGLTGVEEILSHYKK